MADGRPELAETKVIKRDKHGRLWARVPTKKIWVRTWRGTSFVRDYLLELDDTILIRTYMCRFGLSVVPGEK